MGSESNTSRKIFVYEIITTETYYKDTLRRDGLRHRMLLLHNNASSYTFNLARIAIVEQNMTSLSHPSNIAPSVFYLFCRFCIKKKLFYQEGYKTPKRNRKSASSS